MLPKKIPLNLKDLEKKAEAEFFYRFLRFGVWVSTQSSFEWGNHPVP